MRACPLFCRLPVFPSFLHTKKDSLHKTVCENIVLVYCLRVFLYSFPRLRSLCPDYSCPAPILGGSYICGPMRAVVIVSPGRVVSVSCPALLGPGLSMAVVSPARPRHYPLCYPAACAAGPAGSNLCPVAGALKGGKKMKVIHCLYIV